jgi:hypothetical protein
MASSHFILMFALLVLPLLFKSSRFGSNGVTTLGALDMTFVIILVLINCFDMQGASFVHIRFDRQHQRR